VWMIGAEIFGFVKLLAEREHYGRIITSDPRFEGDKIIYRS